MCNCCLKVPINYKTDYQKLQLSDKRRFDSKRIVFSMSTKSKSFHKFLLENTIHRQGFVYGAEKNKILQVIFPCYGIYILK